MRALLVNPELPVCFWTFKHTCEFNGAKAMAPPLGLITVAALLPAEWELRLVDLNTRKLTEQDWEWADLVMFSAMLVQKESLLALIR
ncbi:MAG: B12-binding domain-containing radical SAM protein, partial [Syntrophobacteraceae bacterium]